MSYTAKLTIPKLPCDKNMKLYVYRSKNPDDINTISKVSNLQPIMIIDQQEAEITEVNGKECYIVNDSNEEQTGVIYYGPRPNTVPITEYETETEIVNINSYTYVCELLLKPLDLNLKEGIVYYYSVIGVIDEEDDHRISHLSKVNGVLINYIQEQDLKREIQYCEDYNDSENDIWKPLKTLEYNENDDIIRIGNVNREYAIQLLGLPVIEKVPEIPQEEIHISVNSIISNAYMILEVINPWNNNNEYFNFRKLKSYRIRNSCENSFGDFSIPTFQNKVPVSIEKMIIMMKENPEDSNSKIAIDDETAEKFEIIRREGLYYNRKEHKSISCNRWGIPVEENKLSVFSEVSVQEYINMQIAGSPGNCYAFDIYLIDTYRNISNPTHYVIRT